MSDLVLDKIDPERIEKRIRGKKELQVKSAQFRERPAVQNKDANSIAVEEVEGVGGKVEGVAVGEGKTRIELTPRVVASPGKGLPEQKALPSQVPARSHISNSVRRQVFQKSQGRCCYTDLSTGRRCDETRYLEVDHRIPVALNGNNSIENLQNLCKNHNGYAAIQALGEKLMRPYLG